jgi:hypothetical protein
VHPLVEIGSQGQKFWYPWIGLVTINTHVKYQSPSTDHSKVTAKVKSFLVDDRMTERQNDRMTDRTKTICPQIFDVGGIKMINFNYMKIFSNSVHK